MGVFCTKGHDFAGPEDSYELCSPHCVLLVPVNVTFIWK